MRGIVSETLELLERGQDCALIKLIDEKGCTLDARQPMLRQILADGELVWPNEDAGQLAARYLVPIPTSLDDRVGPPVRDRHR